MSKKKKFVAVFGGVAITIALVMTIGYYGSGKNFSKEIYSYNIESNNDEVEIKGSKFYRDIKKLQLEIGDITLKEDLIGVKKYSAAIYIEEKESDGKIKKEYIYGGSSEAIDKENYFNIKAGEKIDLTSMEGDGKDIKKEVLDKLTGDVKMELSFEFGDNNKKEIIVPLKIVSK